MLIQNLKKITITFSLNVNFLLREKQIIILILCGLPLCIDDNDNFILLFASDCLCDRVINTGDTPALQLMRDIHLTSVYGMAFLPI